VAAAFDPDLDAEELVATVLKLAHEKNKDVYYELNFPVRAALFTRGKDAEDVNHWHCNLGQSSAHRTINWMANNPLRFVLPLLKPFDRERFQATLLKPFAHRRRVRLAVMWVLPWNARDLEALRLEELVDVLRLEVEFL
jgi:hypothetical protein